MTVLSIHVARPVVYTKEPAVDHLRIVSDRAPRQEAKGDMVRGGDDSVRFANLVLPHLDDAYSLARWITGNRSDARQSGVVRDRL